MVFLAYFCKTAWILSVGLSRGSFL